MLVRESLEFEFWRGELVPLIGGMVSFSEGEGAVGRRLIIRDGRRGKERDSALRNFGEDDDWRKEGTLGLPGSRGDVGSLSVPVTYFVKIDRDRKQNLAGVQNEKSTGRT